MSEYVRPAVEQPVFTDENGAVIPYGSRWDGAPPEEAYSVVAHAERFRPLHVVADALIAHLVEEYAATASDDPAAAAGDGAEIGREARAVRVVPASPEASPLTFVFTDFPGVLVHAGEFQRAALPVCGCDACDDEWTRVADELEGYVLGVVAGGLSESVVDGEELRIGSRLVRADGSGESSGWSIAEPDRLADLEGRGTSAPWSRDWAAWPRRRDA
ncbi:DUF6226 family protein [Rathayibacter sp. Leaf296]|uniref:DUF6226 family protein n=1 Tax=Rathayibacter sp. Leaf296 TaxID=1736327 RepID=UPI0007027D76|nr:DUF6226 family protein [Rathayibacter sp. Leaf296]KQQ07607.1 hypothetical protein ASF46_18400 [Rathayibacter sp. Leaf296]